MGQTEIVKSEDRHDHGQQNKTKENEPLKAIAMKYQKNGFTVKCSLKLSLLDNYC